MARAPDTIPDGAPRFGDDRFVCMKQVGEPAVGPLYTTWDTRLRLWRTAMQAHDPEVRTGATTGAAVRHPSRLRVHDVTDDGWIVCETTDARPLAVDGPWAPRVAVHQILSLAEGLEALRAAGHIPVALGAADLLRGPSPERALVLLPTALASADTDPDGEMLTMQLAMLLSTLLRGSPMEATYEDCGATDPGLRAALQQAMGHRPQWAEFIDALRAAEPVLDVPIPTDGPPSRASQRAADTAIPSYVVGDDSPTDPMGARPFDADDVTEQGEAPDPRVSGTPAPAKTSPPQAPRRSPVPMLVGATVLLAAMGAALFGIQRATRAVSAHLQADIDVAAGVGDEVQAIVELSALGFDTSRLSTSDDATVIARDLVVAIRAVQATPAGDTPQGRVLGQRADRLQLALHAQQRAKAACAAATAPPLGLLPTWMGLGHEHVAPSESPHSIE